MLDLHHGSRWMIMLLSVCWMYKYVTLCKDANSYSDNTVIIYKCCVYRLFLCPRVANISINNLLLQTIHISFPFHLTLYLSLLNKWPSKHQPGKSSLLMSVYKLDGKLSCLLQQIKPHVNIPAAVFLASLNAGVTPSANNLQDAAQVCFTPLVPCWGSACQHQRAPLGAEWKSNISDIATKTCFSLSKNMNLICTNTQLVML